MRKILFLTLIITLGNCCAYAQLGEAKRKPIEEFKIRIKKAPKVLSFGWSIIDDNGKAFSNVLLPKSFNANMIPFTFNYDVYYGNGVYYNIKTSFCNFRKGKSVNNNLIESPNLLFAIDLNASLSLNSIYFISENIDMRLITGLGYTNRNIYVFNHAANINFGGGAYIRFNKKIGMHLEMIAKFGLKAPLIRTNTNYVHTSIGFSYFIRSVKYIKKINE